MSKPVYPIYVQDDAIESLLSQFTDSRAQNNKISIGKKLGSTTAKGVGITAALSQLLGLSVNLRKDDE